MYLLKSFILILYSVKDSPKRVFTVKTYEVFVHYYGNKQKQSLISTYP